MRIALLPLDSRPPSWQFPLRIAQIARAELIHPPKEKLGTLHRGADQLYLLDWLADAAKDAYAAVISWDALLYGGLVQSRSEGEPLHIRALVDGLSAVDWQRCQGYLWLTIPRLGMTIASDQQWHQHKLLADYFSTWGEAGKNPDVASAAARLRELEEQLGAEALSRAWWLRRRNLDNAREALQFAASFGFRTCHVAVEDNARTGPHLDELEELRKLSLELSVDARRSDPPRDPPRFTFFDGADECGSLLAARAILDHHAAPPVPVRLSLFPPAPTPDKYYGLYESHSLEDGLHFLARFLGLEFRGEGLAQWLVCFGRQPQPDAFAEDPQRAFASPYLVPEHLQGDEPLFVADLQACNGGNPRLLTMLLHHAGERLSGISAWNTNFNALGLSAATLSVSLLPDADKAALHQLLADRIKDDYQYQSVLRPKLLAECRQKGYNPLDLTEAQTREIEQLAGEPYTFPWNRLFETELRDIPQ